MEIVFGVELGSLNRRENLLPMSPYTARILIKYGRQSTAECLQQLLMLRVNFGGVNLLFPFLRADRSYNRNRPGACLQGENFCLWALGSVIRKRRGFEMERVCWLCPFPLHGDYSYENARNELLAFPLYSTRHAVA
jgi:hypothetical protein